MSLDYKITEAGGQILIEAPHNPTFDEKIKRAGAQWDAENKAWRMDAKEIETARKAMQLVYGRDDQPCETVSVRVTVRNTWGVTRGPIVILGRVIAAATGRDSGARIEKDVAVERGGCDSAGTMTNWETIIRRRTELVLHDVPKRLVDGNDNDDIEIEILNPAILKPLQTKALLAERERLLARLAEIDESLDKLK
jgi:hypothetical protein